ncbi:helicase-related protein [Pseudofrankia inefficax]|uniref:Helicase domain protein n=1 Tax=Pseudofrankia inefficax (strain DSM 45817 / CECT 9037 / DDB 130130 / EuI1c) TaxID=298654 RepID=E3IVZ7_PSEI1|nr:helicase-related protein [Pseudofrankia inefficax]ADP84925.1 helicase domain protein [Pseudofrankia inefficax]
MSGSTARATMEAAVRRELFGPAAGEEPRGKPLGCSSGRVSFESPEASRGVWHDEETRQEILTTLDPLRRYGVGVLYSGPAAHGTDISEQPGHDGAPADGEDELPLPQGLSINEGDVDAPPLVHELDFTDTTAPIGDEGDDLDLTTANAYKPSAMAISFQCDAARTGSLALTVTGAYYDQLAAEWPGRKPQTWWVRRPFELAGTIPADDLLHSTNKLVKPKMTPGDSVPEGGYRVTPTVQIFSRRLPGEAAASTLRLVTIAASNGTAGTGPSAALFQMGLRATAQGALRITPYPDITQNRSDPEEQSIALLYRKHLTYAIGHGCAAGWRITGEPGDAVWAEPMPAHEVVSLTPDVYTTAPDGSLRRVTVSMMELANGTDAGRDQVETVLRLYAEWIGEREAEAATLPQFAEAAARHLTLCREALKRMRAGWRLVGTDPVATRAFQLANLAMYIQQLRTGFPTRKVTRTRDGMLRVEGTHPVPKPDGRKGNWRPFQIAFLLAALPELVDRAAPSRSIVDLIFFPTGGGKTEAYLGASAVSLLARRKRDPLDTGTDTVMRYTLRLLTTQQFLRAAALMCVLDDIRSKNETEFGAAKFGIGIWLGGDSTPNTWRQAVDALRDLARNVHTQNKFLLLRCPWCGTEMGPKPKPRSGQDLLGYQQLGPRKVIFRCVDDQCRFGGQDGLPIHVIDEDIYTARPSLVIGTVDKFAMMAWRPEARALFGIGEHGEREVSPPGLIIQDELHLISGPLGSMVGLYEPVVEDLCTDKRGPSPVPPKIIASTATIRRYEDQIKALYGRPQVALFPPHGLEEGRSFFAERAEGEPGRRYLGVMSASLGSTQTVQVRVASATLLAAASLPEDDRDGYWTNLNFFNSLRELGNTVSLIQSDIPDFITGLRRRDNLESPRWPRIPMELTSRRRSDDIPKAIVQLQTKYGEAECVDICLASNIIEVGVDIDRLGLMTIVGQPKTTSQYIQVSGRVGRDPEKPGLVITIYGAAKPRDRSHYERFRTYHERLYAQVEPTSLTPFAAPVLRRALHGAAVSHMRQTWDASLQPHPFPQEGYEQAIGLLRARALIADADEIGELERMQRDRAHEWLGWARTEWSANAIGGDPKQGLMRFAGTLPELSAQALMWDVPSSMRNVDAECRLKISHFYTREDVAQSREAAQ